jgi:hypothetical protein
MASNMGASAMSDYGASPTPDYGATPPANVGSSAMAPVKTATMAIVSLVLGILSLCICNWTIVVPLAAIITGFMARGNIGKSGGTLKGGGFAMAGIILGIVALLLGCASIGIFLTNGTLSGSFSSGS